MFLIKKKPQRGDITNIVRRAMIKTSNMKKLKFYIRYLFSNTLFFIRRELPESIYRPIQSRHDSCYQIVIFLFDNGEIHIDYTNRDDDNWYNSSGISTKRQLLKLLWELKQDTLND